jgi:hypothetical protein
MDINGTFQSGVFDYPLVRRERFTKTCGEPQSKELSVETFLVDSKRLFLFHPFIERHIQLSSVSGLNAPRRFQTAGTRVTKGCV